MLLDASSGYEDVRLAFEQTCAKMPDVFMDAVRFVYILKLNCFFYLFAPSCIEFGSVIPMFFLSTC